MNAQELLASPDPLPYTVDVDELSKYEPDIEYINPDQYTDELLARSRKEAPERRRQCSIGYHSECSDITGTDGCGCVCHPLFAKMYEDNPVLEKLRNIDPELSAFSRGRLGDGWGIAYDLNELGYLVEDGPGPVEITREDGLKYAAQYHYGSEEEAQKDDEGQETCEELYERFVELLQEYEVTVTKKV